MIRNIDVKKAFLVCCILALVLTMAGPALCKDLKASLGYLPKIAESPEKGEFVDLIKAMDEVYTEGNIQIKVYPMLRSIDNVVKGKADFHMPWLRNPAAPLEKMPYRFVSVKVGNVPFVIFSRKDNPITREKLEKAKSLSVFPYKIEVNAGAEEQFGFPAIGSLDIGLSMHKVLTKRIDACVFAQEEGDHVVKVLRLKDIHRASLGEFDDVIIVQRGKKGDKIDRILSKVLNTMASNGRLQEMYSRVHVPYREWQPYEMGW